MKLLFVYNADSGLFNAVFDSVHKLISPQTYPCNLCNITHSTFSIRERWSDFLSNSPVKIEFTHKDEFTKRNGSTNFQFPIILFVKNGVYEVFISKSEIDNMKSEENLIDLIQEKYPKIANSSVSGKCLVL